MNLVRNLPLIGLLLIPLVAMAEDNEPVMEAPLTPEQLAATSDVVVLAQLRHLDYEYRREIPVSGEAWFEILIPYKVPGAMDQIEVHEEGLHDEECYFERAEGWHEEPRFLLFLIKDEEEGEYRGNPAGCALHVLTSRDAAYVIRYPQENLNLDEEGLDLVDSFDLVGPGARRSTEGMTSIRKAELKEDYHMREEDEALVYTRGIELSLFRPLMGDGLLDEDRQYRRYSPGDNED